MRRNPGAPALPLSGHYATWATAAPTAGNSLGIIVNEGQDHYPLRDH